MNIEGIYYRTIGPGGGERAAAVTICDRARDKADAVLLLKACGLLMKESA